MAKRYTMEELDNIMQQFTELVEMKTRYYLLVDKQIATRKAISNTLISGGVDKDYIIEANDAYEATNKLKEDNNEYIIITELKLPDIDGFKFMTRVEKKLPNANRKFLIITTEASKQNFAMSIKMGAIGFIKKPFKNDELLEQFKKLQIVDE